MKDKRFEIVETEGTAKGIFVIVDGKTGVNYLESKRRNSAGVIMTGLSTPDPSVRCLELTPLPRSITLSTEICPNLRVDGGIFC